MVVLVTCKNEEDPIKSERIRLVPLYSFPRYFAPYFEKIDGAYCFWSVRGWVRAWVGAWVTLFVPTVTFKPLKLES